MRVLLTGGNGFIGRHLTKALLQDDRTHALLSLVRKEKDLHYYEQKADLTNEDDVRQVMHFFRPTMIFHLASNPHVRLGEKDQFGQELWKTNVQGTFHLLAHSPRDCRFVLASSATVYGAGDPFGYSLEKSPICPSSLYGASKAASEALVFAHTAMGKVKGVSLRYVANVGVGATHGVLIDLYKKLRARPSTLSLLGEFPGSAKPYCHVEDTVRATIHVGFSGHTGPINIGPMDNLTILELAQTLCGQLKIDIPFQWSGTSWKGDDQRVHIGNDLLLSTGFSFLHKTSKQAVTQAIKDLLTCPQEYW